MPGGQAAGLVRRGSQNSTILRGGEIRSGISAARLQQGDRLSMPNSRPMPPIGPRCHELRINDVDQTWRIIYRTDPDAIVILEVFSKKTNQTPKKVIDTCKKRIRDYDDE